LTFIVLGVCAVGNISPEEVSMHRAKNTL